MRKYSKPAMQMEAFDIEDVITISAGAVTDIDGEEVGASAPIDVMVDFN